MPTPYSVSRSIGSMYFGGYLNAPINGPLNTNQSPNAMPYHNNGVLTGVKPTPPQFFPSQEPINSDMNANARQQYVRTRVNPNAALVQMQNGKLSRPGSLFNYSTGRNSAVSTHMNYIAPVQSSMYLNAKKSNAIGKSSYKIGLPDAAPISTKNYYPSGARSSLRRARSSGCVAPKKKGAIL
jgi:hypothetical protein